MKIGGREGGEEGSTEFSSTRKKERVMFSSFFKILLMGQKLWTRLFQAKQLSLPIGHLTGSLTKTQKFPFNLLTQIYLTESRENIRELEKIWFQMSRSLRIKRPRCKWKIKNIVSTPDIKHCQKIRKQFLW